MAYLAIFTDPANRFVYSTTGKDSEGNSTTENHTVVLPDVGRRIAPNCVVSFPGGEDWQALLEVVHARKMRNMAVWTLCSQLCDLPNLPPRFRSMVYADTLGSIEWNPSAKLETGTHRGRGNEARHAAPSTAPPPPGWWAGLAELGEEQGQWHALAGHIQVTVVRAEGLLAKDRSGTSDPFVELFVKEPRSYRPRHVQTPVVKKSLDPSWDRNNEFKLSVADESAAVLVCVVYDDDMIGKDLIGSVEVSGLFAFSGETSITEKSYTLMDGGHECGQLILRLDYVPSTASDPHRNMLDLACVFVEDVNYTDWSRKDLTQELLDRGLGIEADEEQLLRERLQQDDATGGKRHPIDAELDLSMWSQRRVGAAWVPSEGSTGNPLHDDVQNQGVGMHDVDSPARGHMLSPEQRCAHADFQCFCRRLGSLNDDLRCGYQDADVQYRPLHLNFIDWLVCGLQGFFQKALATAKRPPWREAFFLGTTPRLGHEI